MRCPIKIPHPFHTIEFIKSKNRNHVLYLENLTRTGKGYDFLISKAVTHWFYAISSFEAYESKLFI